MGSNSAKRNHSSNRGCALSKAKLNITTSIYANNYIEFIAHLHLGPIEPILSSTYKTTLQIMCMVVPGCWVVHSNAALTLACLNSSKKQKDSHPNGTRAHTECFYTSTHIQMLYKGPKISLTQEAETLLTFYY